MKALLFCFWGKDTLNIGNWCLALQQAIIYSSRRFGWSHGSSILLTHHCFKVFSCRDDKEKVLLWGGGGWYRHWNWPAKKKYKRAMWSIFQLPCYVFVHHFLIYQQRYWPWLQWQLLHHKRRAQCTEMIYNLIRKFLSEIN